MDTQALGLTDLVLPFHQKKDALLEDLTPSSLFFLPLSFLFPLPPSLLLRLLLFRPLCSPSLTISRPLSSFLFARPRDPHTPLLLQWPLVPLSARSRQAHLLSCFLLLLLLIHHHHHHHRNNNNNHHHPAASPRPSIIVSPPLAAGQHQVHFLSYSSFRSSERARGLLSLPELTRDSLLLSTPRFDSAV